MDPVQVLLRVALAPALAAAVSGRLLRGRPAAGAVALGLGALTAYVGVVGWPAWPMVSATQKLWLAALLGGVTALAPERGRRGLVFVAGLHLALFGWVFFRSLDRMGQSEALAWGLALPSSLALLGRAARPSRPGAVGAVAVAAALLSGLQMQAGSFVLSFLSGGVCVALLSALAVGVSPRHLAPAAIAPLGFLTATGHLYGELPLWAVVVVGILLAASARR
ncbi:MAG: hypothetical protein H6741_26485 [Alphaproteobacteria bacterium]|nr:hypothetical protein [Alphaproteobacteria bacterium]MCB9796257.1 hypothetical protein [Alphaproteobacteria bacterium]